MQYTIVKLCKGCVQCYKDENKPNLGFKMPIKVKQVPVQECDNWTRTDGTFNFEHYTREIVEEN